MIGTPEYMSPEQAMSERVLDARSDVYSLACVLYEMLAGEPPYTARTALAPREAARRPRARRAATAARGAGGVEQALKTALAKVPPTGSPRHAFVEALTAPDPARAPAVAVLPFLSLSADPENEYFADGITEDVIAHLSKIHSLKVISRSSVMPFKTRVQGLKEIAAILGASTVLEGSVRNAGDRVRIVAQLIDAETDRHLWAETYDRELTDIFAIQTDVALHIAAALKAELSVDEQTRIRKEHTRDLKAYQLYVQGRHWLVKYTAPAMKRAIVYFERAIAGDPDVCARVRQRGDGVRRDGGGRRSWRRTYARRAAKAAGANALTLDPTLGEAHCAMAYLDMSAFRLDERRARVSACARTEPGQRGHLRLVRAACAPRSSGTTRRSRCSSGRRSSTRWLIGWMSHHAPAGGAVRRGCAWGRHAQWS